MRQPRHRVANFAQVALAAVGRARVLSALRVGVAPVLIALLAMSVPSRPAGAAESIALPFPGGTQVKIIQGYQTGTHWGDSGYALDLVLVGAETSGAEVLAPVSGSIEWAFGPGSGNGCLSIDFGADGFSVVLCHVIY